MKRLMFALAAMVPMVMCSGCYGHRWLDKAFCEPCNAGHLVGGCWNGQCGLGPKSCTGCKSGGSTCKSGCSSCVRGQGEVIGEGEMITEGHEGMIMEGEGMPMAGCDCPNCARGRGHGHGLFHRHRGGMPPWARGPVAGGPPTAQVAYPYYTTRAPRDFLNPNPRSIGR